MSNTETLPDTEQQSKDAFFARIAVISDEMITAHGKEFTMGTLVLAARWIAANRKEAFKDMQ